MPEMHDSGLTMLLPKMLRSVDLALEQVIGPEVGSSGAKVQVDMARCLLRWAAVQLESHRMLYAARTSAEAKLASPRAREAVPSGTGGLYDVPTAAEKRFSDLAIELGQELGAAMARSGTSGEIADRLSQLLAAELQFYGALDPESVASVSSSFQGGKSSGRESFAKQFPPVTNVSLTKYLTDRFPECGGIRASGVTLLAGGMGKDTILFELSGHPTYSGALVIRKDLAENSLDSSAVDEFSLLKAVHEAGVVVPEPIWYERDASQLGTPFIIVRRALGSVALSQDFSDPKIRRHFADQLARELAAIHAIPVPDIELFRDVHGKNIHECVHAQIAKLHDFWLRKRLEPSVKLDIAFQWLEANIPPDPGFAPTLVHGDYGFHNLIVHEGAVTAILDWEFSHAGDPAEDVNYCRQFVEPVVPWADFLALYAKHGGKPYDDQRDNFFTVWRNVRNAVACVGAMNAFLRGDPGNIKMATAGLSYGPRFELEVLRLITDQVRPG
jgi:aminoglycoside phosphotransferase (APT) family kinase protein